MSKKVIIIDDSLTALNMIKTAFAAGGWEVYGAQNANNGMEMIYSIAPDLIITDAVMPVMGGFQLLKAIKKDKKISEIPVIVYSVLPESNAKFYIKEKQGEYYLQKNDDLTKLTNFADVVVQKHPVSLSYKYEVLKAEKEHDNSEKQDMPLNLIFESKPLKIDKLESEFKEIYNFSKTDDKIIQDVFTILYPILQYNLAVVCINSEKNIEKTAYFDIRDIILSPIFQNSVMQKLNAKDSFLYKKYAPNLKVITNEGEFLTKTRFDFEYNEKNIANIIFYSKEKLKWTNNADLQMIKAVLDNFFRARYLNKTVNTSKNEISSRYFVDKFDFKFDSQNKKQMYIAIIEMYSFKDVQDKILPEDLDIINSKTSEKLINFIGDDEQIYKNDEGDYNVVLFSKDENQLHQRLNLIINLLDEIRVGNNKTEAVVGACNCKIDNQFNFYEAQKLARKALSNTNSQNRIVIYDAK